MATAHPENIKQRTLLLYDSDTNKSNTRQGEIFIRCMPVNQENTLFKRGIENLLTIPINFPKENFYNTKENEKTDDYSAKTKTTKEELNKMKLCKYICDELKEDEQKKYLNKFDLLFKIIEYAIND
ncbi:MAG: hypothetical protein IPO21_09365 [Bacteroidales bacterium]|nr:hypothetical protein [Bacteroidales bacterium]